MHGKYKDMVPPGDADIRFVAQHYGKAMITTGTGCPRDPTGETIEQSVQSVAARIKAVLPSAKVGMYWRQDFALELAGCSGFKEEWAAHPEWILKDDEGHSTKKYYDYLNPAFRAFWTRVLFNATAAMLPTGKPVLE